MSSGRKTSIYLSDSLIEKIGCYPITKRMPGKAVSTMVNRHLIIYSAEKASLKKIFTEEELNSLSMICRGVIWEPAEKIRDGVLHQIQDCSDSMLDQYNLRRAEIENKLHSLTVSQQYTLVELLERIMNTQVAS